MGFWSTVLLSASIASIAAIGLFLQIRSGQLNVGMAPFVGVGGYVSGALGVHLGMSPVFSIPLAIAAGFVVGCLFSAVTLRLHHWFFAVTTLALSIAAVSAVGLIDVIGGPTGMTGIPFVTSPVVIVSALGLTIVLAFWLDRSRIGLAVRATGDDELLARAFGVRVKALRVVIFGIGTGLGALSGALYAHRFGVYQPTDLDFHHSLLLLVYVIVGGKRSVFGPLLGTFFLFTMPEFIKISPEAELIVFGALMIIVATSMPDGLIGILLLLRRWFTSLRLITRGSRTEPAHAEANPREVLAGVRWGEAPANPSRKVTQL